MKRKIRYAVVGLGHIAQAAVLPAFKQAKVNSELTALISGDATKLRVLGKQYKVENLFDYSEYEKCMASGLVDAVYIATPNTMHRQFAEIAAKHGVHVLTEKPMAPRQQDCLSMIQAARLNKIKLMVAYRLHFDPANLAVIETINKGQIGDARIFNSTFTMQVADLNNIRLQKKMAGGPLYDIGIYCINAARYIFQDEPVEVSATRATSNDPRFKEVEEMIAVTMRFTKARLATFAISFGAADSSMYEVLGTAGQIRLQNSYEMNQTMTLTTKTDSRERKKVFKKHDQFAPELQYFSDCILKNKEPEPSGEEGLLDIKIIEAIYRSLRTGQITKIDYYHKTTRPTQKLRMQKPAHGMPRIVNANGPQG
ncbi:MAG: Gfo/Idh/MocA family oxidoreductase [Bdellovibrio sp.]